MDADSVQAEMATGLAFTCAVCEKLWAGKRAGLNGCLGKSCRGPMGGDVFPEYEGVLTPEARVRMCFRCGEPSDAGMKFSHSSTILGVCQKHLDEVELWRRKSEPKSYKTPEQLRMYVKR